MPNTFHGAPIPEASSFVSFFFFFNMAIPAEFVIYCYTEWGGAIISPNNEFSSLKRKVEVLLIYIAMKINWRETRFSIMKAN